MAIDDIVEELLLRWERDPSWAPEDLCQEYRSCPEYATLLEAVRQAIRDLQVVAPFLDTSQEDGCSLLTPFPPPGEAGQRARELELEPTGQATPRIDFDALRAAAAPPAPTSEASLADRPSLVAYELLAELGRGGMGVVYKARQATLKRLVALKMILAGSQASPEQLARFRREAVTVAHLQHPNIAQIYEIGEHQGQLYFSLEYVDGGSLDKQIAGRPQPEKVAAQLVETLARVMHFAHQKGIIHRDLKPANVLLARSDRLDAVELGDPTKPGRYEPKITDFGLAKEFGGDTGQTQSGAILGTPNYMAPEQAAGKTRELGPLTDVYALGAILYEMLTGRPPFRGATPLETLHQVSTEEPVPPSRLRPNLHRHLETICLKALAKEPTRRYSSGLMLAQDLERFRAGEPILARPVGFVGKTWRKVRRHKLAVVSVAMACLVLSLGGYFVYREMHARQTNLLVQALEPGLNAPEITPAYLELMERRIAELNRLAPEEAARGRERLYQGYAAVVRKQIANPLTSENLSAIETALHLLESPSRAPALAVVLREDLGQRSSTWEPLFNLTAGSWADLPGIFDAIHLEARDDHMELKGAPGAPSEVLILSKKACSGNAELSAEFAPSWPRASQLGLVLNGAQGRGYAFLLRSSELPSSNPSKGPMPAVNSFAEVKKAGGLFSLLIVRNGKVLRQQPLKAGALADGSVRMKARREGDRLTLEVEGTQPLQFQDGFPLSHAEPGVFGLACSANVLLQSLRARQKVLASRPSALERGDDLYARGPEYYGEALAAYQDQASAAGTPELSQEARYKAALCLLRLKRYEDAATLLRRLATEPGERLPLMAQVQLLLLSFRQDRLRDADDILKSLSFTPSDVFADVAPQNRLERLAALVPDEDIREIAQAAMTKYRGIDLLRFIFRFERAYLSLLEQLVALSDQLHFQAKERIFTKFALACAYHYTGRLQDAVRTTDELLQSDRAAAYALGLHPWLVHKYCWLLREGGDPRKALGIVDEHLYQGAGVYQPTSLTLLAERARIHAALGDWNAAEKDLDELFRLVPVERLSYPVYAVAWLMRGFIAEDRGERDRALAAWRQGLYKVYIRRKTLPVSRLFALGLLESPLGQGPLLAASTLVAGRAAGKGPMPAQNPFGTEEVDSVIYGWLLASLADEGSDDDIEPFLSLLFPGVPKIGLGWMKHMALHDFLPAASWRGIWQTPRGRRYARQMTFQTIRLHEALHDPLVLVAAEIIRRGAFSGRPTSEQEEVLGEQVERGYSVFFGGQLSYDQIMAQLRPLLAVWNGSNPDLKAWEQVEGQLEPSFRSGVAYLFGRRHLRLGKWDQAEVLFHCALANASRDSRLHRLVQTEVASLEAVQLNNASWAVVCQPGAEKATYNQCLEKAQRACLLVPDNGLYLNTLGVAQYRLGQYPSAVDTLMRSDKLNERRFQGSFPADLAFLAMAQHQLGRRQEAQATLTRLRQVAKQPRWAREPNTQGFLREAESLLKPAKP